METLKLSVRSVPELETPACEFYLSVSSIPQLQPLSGSSIPELETLNLTRPYSLAAVVQGNTVYLLLSMVCICRGQYFL